MKLQVRWHDGYLEEFGDVLRWRCGMSTLYIEHVNGKKEWIPLISVRRFTFDQEGP